MKKAKGDKDHSGEAITPESVSQLTPKVSWTDWLYSQVSVDGGIVARVFSPIMAQSFMQMKDYDLH
jgi:hypothetical protein